VVWPGRYSFDSLLGPERGLCNEMSMVFVWSLFGGDCFDRH
jgi:hypothetical protein